MENMYDFAEFLIEKKNWIALRHTLPGRATMRAGRERCARAQMWGTAGRPDRSIPDSGT